MATLKRYLAELKTLNEAKASAVASQNVAKAVMSAARVYDKISKQIRFIHGLAESSKVFRKLCDEFEDLLPKVFPEEWKGGRFYEVLFICSWPPLSGATANLAIKIERLYAKHGKDRNSDELDFKIAKVICKEFGREVVLAIKGKWSRKKHLGKRRRVLGKAIDAHVNRDYELSVPALLPQLEGIVAENFGHKGWLSVKKFKSYIEKIFRENIEGWNEEELARRFVLDVILAKFEWGMPLPQGPGRHSILHGANVDYATEETSLKIILFLKFLIDSMGFFAGSSRVLHGVRCKVGRRMMGEKQFYSNVQQGVLDGCKPCRLCLREHAKS